MNERDFVLLVEKYLDGTLSPNERSALRDDVQSNHEHRRLFEEQTRQHIRIHAQTSKVDFAESQRIAVLAIDVVEKHKDPNAFLELLRPKTLRERVSIMLRGLHSGKETPAYRAARDELVRLFGPVTVSVVLNVTVVLLLLILVPYAPRPPKPEGVTVTVRSATQPPDLDPVPKEETPPAPGERVIPILLAGPTHTPPEVFDKGKVTEPTPGEYRPDEDQRKLADTSFQIPKTTPFTGLGIMEGRDFTNRNRILAKTVNGSTTETAVTQSLQWLKAHQASDGSWPGQDPIAMTGLALLAYLAHGEVPASPVFGDTVTRALRFLIAGQDKAGAFSRNVYAHAIATYAVAEAFTMTRIVDLKGPLERGVRVILDGQQSRGGFDYNYQKNQRFDTSVTGWQIQALKAAKIAGADVAGLEQGLAKAARFLETDAFARDGSGFLYEGKAGIPSLNGGKPSMTGVGTLCLQMLGKPNLPQVRAGLRALQNAELDWPDSGKASVYSGYYITQAKFQSGDKAAWANWNKLMQKRILARQEVDGHWEKGDYDNGSHVYTTTLCTLMLEVYYRYLPTYAKRAEPAQPDKISSGDVSVDVR